MQVCVCVCVKKNWMNVELRGKEGDVSLITGLGVCKQGSTPSTQEEGEGKVPAVPAGGGIKRWQNQFTNVFTCLTAVL